MKKNESNSGGERQKAASSGARAKHSQAAVKLPKPTDEQLKYFKEIRRDARKYDAGTIIGGPSHMKRSTP